MGNSYRIVSRQWTQANCRGVQIIMTFNNITWKGPDCSVHKTITVNTNSLVSLSDYLFSSCFSPVLRNKHKI